MWSGTLMFVCRLGCISAKHNRSVQKKTITWEREEPPCKGYALIPSVHGLAARCSRLCSYQHLHCLHSSDLHWIVLPWVPEDS